MPSVVINDGHVVYDILGDTGELIVLTPGGRFGMDIPGLRPLAEALVAGGHRVLLWDRPNCGASDVQFFGHTESHMRADTLRGLLTALELGPCVLAGGSGGARDSMLTAILYPELVSRLVLWNIVGGVYGTLNLGAHYILPSLQAVRGRGIDGLLRLREWRDRIEANPRNRERLESLDREEFLRLSLRWLQAYVPKPGQTIPGVDDELFDRIQVPTLIVRGGAKDLDHPKRTSLEVHCLIENSVLIDPPWPEDAWERAMEEFMTGRTDHYNMFDTWVLAAPEILKFLAEQ
ncbi:alpha/beta fold hydrolase [Nocardia sp. NPDC055321]